MSATKGSSLSHFGVKRWKRAATTCRKQQEEANPLPKIINSSRLSSTTNIIKIDSLLFRLHHLPIQPHSNAPLINILCSNLNSQKSRYSPFPRFSLPANGCLSIGTIGCPNFQDTPPIPTLWVPWPSSMLTWPGTVDIKPNFLIQSPTAFPEQFPSIIFKKSPKF